MSQVIDSMHQHPTEGTMGFVYGAGNVQTAGCSIKRIRAHVDRTHTKRKFRNFVLSSGNILNRHHHVSNSVIPSGKVMNYVTDVTNWLKKRSLVTAFPLRLLPKIHYDRLNVDVVIF